MGKDFIVERCLATPYLLCGTLKCDNPASLPADLLGYRINGEDTAPIPSVYYNGTVAEFYFPWPQKLEANDIVEIFNSQSNEMLHAVDIACVLADPPVLYQNIAALLSRLPNWSVDGIRTEGQEVAADGWIVGERQVDTYVVVVNGQAMTITNVFRRQDVEKALPNIRPESRLFGFEASTKLKRARRIGDGRDEPYLHFALKRTVDSNSDIAVSYYCPPKSLVADFPLPTPERIGRVYGADNPAVYVQVGYSNYRRIRNLIVSMLPADLDHLCILDWGCGCAGVGRYFISEPQFSYAGCDIDGDNIDWCKRTFPNAEFQPVAQLPPTNFPDSQFDVIFGISVFTHLNEENQFLWLSELNRLIRPGGLVLVSVHGAEAMSRLGGETLINVLREGCHFQESHHRIGEIINNQSYYGTTYHCIDYILREWPAKMRLVQYRPGAIGGHQDLVVLTKR